MKRLIAEFEEQSFTQIIFPHKESDWLERLDEAELNFIDIINVITKYQKCLVVCHDLEYVKSRFESRSNLFFTQFQTNDAWARDCSALCVEKDGEIKLLDFTFNAWGGKFEATKDNLMSKNLSRLYSKELQTVDFVLEGGGVESNGADLLLTTCACTLNKNRNPNLNPLQITQRLNEAFGAKTLYLEHGRLKGDDTDSHVDTLARFISPDAIAYVKCEKETDEHFDELLLMEKELQAMAQTHNLNLVALPMPDAVLYQGERLAATYANFLFVNGAVLVPTYGVKQDKEAIELFEKTFQDRDVVGVDCRVLLRQGGSLHCVTMNFASGVDLFV